MVKKLILIPDDLNAQIKSFCKITDINYMDFVRDALKAHFDSLKEQRDRLVIEELTRILGKDIIIEKFLEKME